MKLRWEIAWGIFFGYILVSILTFIVFVVGGFLLGRVLTPDALVGFASDATVATSEAAGGTGTTDSGSAVGAEEPEKVAEYVEPNEQGAVQAFADNRNAITPPFEMDEPWVLLWMSEDPSFRFHVIDLRTEEIIDSPDADAHPSYGYTVDLPSGDYYLEVVADGPWRAEIVPAEVWAAGG